MVVDVTAYYSEVLCGRIRGSRSAVGNRLYLLVAYVSLDGSLGFAESADQLVIPEALKGKDAVSVDFAQSSSWRLGRLALGGR